MDVQLIVTLLLIPAGVFTVFLGCAHFFFPILLDFDTAIPREGNPLKPFRLGPIRYPTQRSDVRGLASVMNNAVSFTLVSIGVADLLWQQWLPTQFGTVLGLWIATFWLLRTVSELHLGRRHGDQLVMVGFALLGSVHIVAVVALLQP